MKIISKWEMDGNLKDKTGHNHGIGHNIEYAKGVDGKKNGAVKLSGRESYIEIPDDSSLHLGKDDFFVGLWAKFPKNRMSIGDLLCKYDDDKRQGFNLTVNGTSGGYTGISDTRNIYFGIDDGYTGNWEDCGKPCDTNTLISTMCVYNGELYAGISDAKNDEKACRVYRYDKQGWLDCGRLGNNPKHRTVHSMLVFKGKLYAATGMWDWDKAYAGDSAIGRVFCYNGGTEWIDCGQVGIGYRIMAMASYRGELYAATDSSEVFKYTGGKSWEFCGGDRRPKSEDSSDIFRLDSLLSDGKDLFGGGKKRIFRYKNAAEWECVAHNDFEVTQIHKLQLYKGHLISGTWPHGRVIRYDKNFTAENMGQLGINTDKYQINEVNDLICYNGKLYAGVIPKAQVYRYDGDFNWHKSASLVNNPEYSPEDITSWNRVTSMAIFKENCLLQLLRATADRLKLLMKM